MDSGETWEEPILVDATEHEKYSYESLAKGELTPPVIMAFLFRVMSRPSVRLDSARDFKAYEDATTDGTRTSKSASQKKSRCGLIVHFDLRHDQTGCNSLMLGFTALPMTTVAAGKLISIPYVTNIILTSV